MAKTTAMPVMSTIVTSGAGTTFVSFGMNTSTTMPMAKSG